MTNSQPLLSVKNLSKTFVVEKDFFGNAKKKLQAVRNVNFQIASGECLTLVGESGCGKSTTARLIMQLLEPDSGKIVFLNQELSSLKENDLRDLRKDFQMVFQNPFSSLDPRYKVFDAIAEPLEVHNYGSKEDIKKRVYELLELVELDADIALKYPHQCSGGQNQRVSIARALALNPKLIVADEAVSALDVSIQWKVLHLIKKLQKELNISFLFIAHNLGVVKYVADTVAVMYLGEIVELASEDELFSSPQHPYTKALIASAPVPDPRQRDREKIFLDGEIPKATDIPNGCPFHTRCPIAQASCKTKVPKFEEKTTGHFVSCDLV